MINRELLNEAINKLKYNKTFDVRNPLYSDKEITCGLIRQLGYMKVLNCRDYMYNKECEE